MVMRFTRLSSAKLSLVVLLAGTFLGLSTASAKNIQAADDRPLAPSDLALLDRVTWGASASSAADLARLGPDKWLKGQLHPASGDHLPSTVQAEIDALTISQTSAADKAMAVQATNQQINTITDPDAKRAALVALQKDQQDCLKQAIGRQILRDVYSTDQLKEQMTWFWFNHFNVVATKANLRVLVGDYEDHAIRPHALGKFRDLLEATVRHPAMLRYLDNTDSAVGHINENYAREIMELHTMGVGSGYTQTDVQELARILTGVGINLRPDTPRVRPELQSQVIRDGLFEFYPARHDYGDKVFLGHAIKGRGYAEVEEALDILCRQPATARHISTQLATYFVADDPPPALVDKMAKTFEKSDGDIAAVLETMFRSPEFKASLGTEFKDPMHYVISGVRLAYGDQVILNPAPVQNWLNRLAEPLYAHETPDGYPLAAAAWNGPGQMATRFEIARAIGSNSAGLFKPDEPGAVDHPGFPQLQNALYYTTLSKILAQPTQASLQQAVSPQDWNTLFLSSPDFMHR
jgi:uncharacterized protein (DUF1800 family)